ncbi:MAG: hypothetical protein DMG60_06030 [Acidobacteria bacterium]|nr:MAG: hypothetical protein DMG60_06030 [Acidobacteriota bacterium]
MHAVLVTSSADPLQGKLRGFLHFLEHGPGRVGVFVARAAYNFFSSLCRVLMQTSILYTSIN